MATLSYTQETMPKSSEEFQRQLAEALANSNPIDDLLELAANLRGFEKKYGMASEEFYRRFLTGKMGDDLDIMEWAAVYDLYLGSSSAMTMPPTTPTCPHFHPTNTQRMASLRQSRRT